MRGLTQDRAALCAQAYLAWWNDAGIDVAVGEDPANWLRPASQANVRPAQRVAAQALPDVSATIPDTLAAFQAWLGEDPTQPERRWPDAPILPVGTERPALMIVTDMPDLPDMEAGTLLADRAGVLLDNMLQAIGIDAQSVYRTSLFCARPPGGMVEAGDLVIAADRMRTHVHLARPAKLLFLGDRTARALLPPDTDGSPHGLRHFNLEGGTVPTIATFHPRLLLSQPAAKARCWQDLQYLIEDPCP